MLIHNTTTTYTLLELVSMTTDREGEKERDIERKRDKEREKIPPPFNSEF